MYSLNHSIILGGDFNMILDGMLDHAGSAIQAKSRFNTTFLQFMDKLKLVDIWRKRNPGKRQFTFRQKTPLIQSRLDYWIISSNMETFIEKCEILSSISPDHSVILLRCNNLKRSLMRGRSYWKFNNSLCSDKTYTSGLKNEILCLKKQWGQCFPNKSLLWDFVKMKIRDYTRKYSKQKATERNEQKAELEKEIQHLEQTISGNPSSRLFEALEEKRALLSTLYDYGLDGLKVRSRAPWFESGEKKSDFFKQLLLSNKRKCVIQKLMGEDDRLHTGQSDILDIIKSFYNTLYLYKEHCIDGNVILKSFPFLQYIPTLSDDSKDSCEGKLSKSECYEALKSMQLNKSPGNDGLTTEFYLTFWHIVDDLVVDSLNEAFDLGELSASQKQGVITLIAKEGKDPLYIKNYRPITLLNTDYKILTKVLTKKIKEVLPEIVQVDQVGYMNGRNIGEAVRLIDDILFHASNNSFNGYLVAVDFEKAFDSVSHGFLQKVLEIFGFGTTFRKWIKVLYTGACSCVMNDGHSTGYFEIQRGVRQGDPISPYLFVLIIEILANVIRNDKGVMGIPLDKNEVKQVLYADDVTIFVKDVSSLQRLEVLFDAFSKISGLKVNRDKTKLLRLGIGSNQDIVPKVWKMVNEVKILGIYFSLDINIKEEMNYKEILSKIKKLLGWWKQRDLSILGKIQLLKTYALSKLTYVSSLIVVPKWVYKEIEKITFDFIWNGQDKVKRNTMFQNYDNGGLRMTNFELFIKAQRVMWMKRLIYSDKEMKWKAYFNHICKSIGGVFIFHCNYDVSKISLKIPTFYVEILKVWQEMEECRRAGNDNISDEIIFNNKHVCINNQMVFDDKLYSYNIYKMHHLLSEDGSLKSVLYFQNRGLNGNDILKIYGLFDAIPSQWKRVCRFNTTHMKRNFDDHISVKIFGNKENLDQICSKKLYTYFINSLKKIGELKNISTLFTGLTENEIKYTFLRPRSSTVNNKLREFQFKQLHGAIYTNVKLHKIGLIPNNVCSYCGIEVETYEHLFNGCVKVQTLWKGIGHSLKLKEIQNLSQHEVLLGIKGNSNRVKCLNTLILIVKKEIYFERQKGELPSVDHIKKLIKENMKEEYKIAEERNTLTVHLQKWDLLRELDRPLIIS